MKDTEDKVNQILIFPEGASCNGEAIISFKKGAFIPMKPIQINCVKWISDFNMSNIGLRTLFSREIAFLGKTRRKMIHYQFDPFDPAKIGLTDEKDWEVFAQKVKDIMCKVLDKPDSKLSFRD